MKRNYFVAQERIDGKLTARLIALPPLLDILTYSKQWLKDAECLYSFKSKKEAETFYNGCLLAYERGYNHAL